MKFSFESWNYCLFSTYRVWTMSVIKVSLINAAMNSHPFISHKGFFIHEALDELLDSNIEASGNFDLVFWKYLVMIGTFNCRFTYLNFECLWGIKKYFKNLNRYQVCIDFPINSRMISTVMNFFLMRKKLVFKKLVVN